MDCPLRLDDALLRPCAVLDLLERALTFIADLNNYLDLKIKFSHSLNLKLRAKV